MARERDQWWSQRLTELRRAIEEIRSAGHSLRVIADAAAVLFDADVSIRVLDPEFVGFLRIVHRAAAPGSTLVETRTQRVRVSSVEEAALARHGTAVGSAERSGELPKGLGAGVKAAMACVLDDLTVREVDDLASLRPVTGLLVLSTSASDRLFTQADVDVAGQLSSMCSMLASEQRRMAALQAESEQTARSASRDQSTGLANRRELLSLLDAALDRAREKRSRLGVVFIDLDDFHLVNEHYGHAVGDGLVVAFAGRLNRILRENEFAARLAADEFVVVIEDIAEEIFGHLLVERVRIALGQPFKIGDAVLHCEASFGLAFATGGLSVPSAAALLQDATAALYRAKEEGKARSVVFDASMRERAVTERDLVSALRHAVRYAPIDGSGPLTLYYQPVVALETGATVSVEALLRWTSQGRTVPPDDFIPIAESSGLIGPLGRWVLEAACQQTAVLRNVAPDLGVAINISGRQLADPSIVADTMAALRAAGLPPEAVTLEVTETYLLERNEDAVRCLRELQSLGVRTALDDFGTGYASLTALRLFQFDICKVDRAFVQGLSGEGSERVLGEMLIGVARQLGMQVVAEGVETHEQMARAKALGCDFGQGFHLARPMPATQLIDRLSAAAAR